MNPFRKPFVRLLLAALVVGLSGCDLSGVNEDPNNPTQVPEALQLSGLLGAFSYEVVGGQPARVPAHWVQQLSFGGSPPSFDNYDFDESDSNNLWAFTAYTDVMNNARELATRAEANGNYAYAAIAKTIMAFNLGIMTDLFGDVPYTQAFDPSRTQPPYDTQQQVYEQVFALLEAALADYDLPSPRTPGTDDLLYGGNMARWKKLTYMLIARFNIHLTRAPGNTAAQRAQQALDALQNGFAGNADDADYRYYATTGQENPWFQWAIDGKWDTRNQLSAHYVTLLQSTNDPRLPVQARPAGAVNNNGPVAGFNPANPVYVGHQNGLTGPGASAVSSIGTFYSAPNAPLTWISYAEGKFIEAEARFILSGAAAAEPVYRQAIAASMNKLGVPAAARDAYLAARPALTAENALREIMVEKYVANFLNLDVYNDWRRNGFPQLTPVTEQARAPRIPLRFPYPISELTTNAANVDATGVPRGTSALAVPVWWDTTL